MPRRKEPPAPPPAEHCAVPGCIGAGEYRAPRSRDSLHDYQYFCLDHVKEFNKAWNFFDRMSQPEIEAFQKDAFTGHRPVWKTNKQFSQYEAAIASGLGNILGDMAFAIHQRRTSPVGPKERDALAVLDMEHPTTKKDIKLRYKLLVKKYHPDVNSGKEAEETFKRVAAAYNHLMEHYVESI